MIEPFGNKNYKFGIESFLIMYLNQYDVILGSDLENYIQNGGIFNEQYPSNLYFVLKRPKVSVDPKSVKIEGKKVTFSFKIHQQEKHSIINLGIELVNATTGIEFKTEYPYNLFTISDKEKVLLVTRPSTIIDNVEEEFINQIPALDYEILYIGQAYGKDGKRTAIDRLSSHETVQKIYTHSLTQNPDSDICFMLAKFTQDSMLFVSGSESIVVSEKNQKIENERVKHVFKNNGLSFSEKQRINFTEAALIKFFEPKYNIEFKNCFPSQRHKSYSECYNLDVRGISIELDTSELNRKLFTKKIKRNFHHMKIFEFKSDEDRISLLKLFSNEE